MRELTARQQEVLDWIKTHVREHGMPPTRTELAHGLGMTDASSVRGHLNALQKKGWIDFRPDKYRGIRVLNNDVPLIRRLGEVAAGKPIVCEEHIVDQVPSPVADQFRPRPDYLLTVRGDSMNRTVRDGDIIAVHKTAVVESGQVVVARFGDEVTLKRFVRLDERHIELRPESYNPAHKVLKLDLVKHRLEIDGVAVGALIKELREVDPEGPEGEHPTAVRMQPKSEL